MLCPQCGFALEEGMTECPRCKKTAQQWQASAPATSAAPAQTAAKRVLRCQRCGIVLPPTATYCPICDAGKQRVNGVGGAAPQATPAAAPAPAPKAATPAPTVQPAPAAAPTFPTAPPTHAPQAGASVGPKAPAGTRFCQHCGQALAPAVAFCTSCGTPAGGGASAARATSAEFAGRVRATSQDAWQAFKRFAINPVGGIEGAFAALGQMQALYVGIAFAIASDCALFLSIAMAANRFGGRLDFGTSVQLLLFGLIPAVSFFAAIFAARNIFRGEGCVEGDAFHAGASVLPMGIFLLAVSIIGFSNIEVVAILAVFALCYTILLLYSGCTKIAKISEAGAAAAVPIILLLSIWVMKIILARIVENAFGGMLQGFM